MKSMGWISGMADLIPSALSLSDIRDVKDRGLLTMLEVGRNCSATDPRDKIFALLGLANDRLCKDIQIDYSWSVQVVYFQVPAILVDKYSSLAFIPFATYYERLQGLPSSVLDWTREPEKIPITSSFSSASHFEHPNPGRDWKPQIVSHGIPIDFGLMGKTSLTPDCALRMLGRRIGTLTTEFATNPSRRKPEQPPWMKQPKYCRRTQDLPEDSSGFFWMKVYRTLHGGHEYLLGNPNSSPFLASACHRRFTVTSLNLPRHLYLEAACSVQGAWDA
jgi:hypothetical protein